METYGVRKKRLVRDVLLLAAIVAIPWLISPFVPDTGWGLLFVAYQYAAVLYIYGIVLLIFLAKSIVGSLVLAFSKEAPVWVRFSCALLAALLISPLIWYLYSAMQSAGGFDSFLRNIRPVQI